MERRKALINLIFCSILHGLNHYIIIFAKPMYTSMADYFTIDSVEQITQRMTLMYVGYGISNFLSGVLSRRFSLKLILFFGTLLMSISTMLVSFVPQDSYFLMGWLVFLIGLGGGTYHPAANTLITASYEGRQGHAIGMLSIGAVIGFVIAPFVGEYIGAALGFKNLYFVSGLTCFLFCFIMLFTLTDFEKKAYAKHLVNQENINSNQHTGKVLLIVIALMCIPVTIRELMVWSYYEISPFWVKYGFSAGISIGIMQAMQYFPGIITQPLTGKLCDKTNPIFMVIVTFGIMAMGFAMLALTSAWSLWAGIILFGIGSSSSTVASETFMAYITTPKDRPLVYGIALSVGLGLGGFLAGFSGTIVDKFGKESRTGYQLWFVSIAIILALSVSVYMIIKKMKKNPA